MSTESFVIIEGDPVSGFKYWGPFLRSDYDPAEVGENVSGYSDWWVADLEMPPSQVLPGKLSVLPLIPGVDYTVACCPVCGSSDPDMSKHQECMDSLGVYPDQDDSYPGRV